MAGETLNWLLVGGGDIARKRVGPALAAAQGSQLVGVCDLVPERAEALARELSASEVYTDYADALQKTSAEAVYVATPVFLHSSQAVAAIEAGKHVLVEKPLGLDAADALRAADAAARSSHLAGCAYFRRCSPRYLHARDMLRAGQFGRIVLVRMTYFSWFNPDPADPKYWRVLRSKGGGGVLADMGTHMFDVLIGLLGMPRSVFAKVGTLVHPYEADDSAAIVMMMPDGVQVIASLHWNSKTWSHEFEIVGTEAKLKWHPYDAGKVVRTVGRQIAELDLPNPDNVHLPLVQDFVDAVRDGRPPAVTLEEAAKTNILLDAVYRSAEAGKEIAL